MPNRSVADQNNRRGGEASNRLSAAIAVDALRQAEKETRALARSHYENFMVATLLLPRRLRQPFYNVYAFCRTADDLADESANPQEARLGLERFQQQLDQTFMGNPAEGLFLALANTIDQFGLPQQPFDDLLDAFRQDQNQNRYATRDELLDYCRRSANPVGRIVLRLCDCFNATNADLSDRICTGLQLVNFWQDVSRDFAIGRVYLPTEAMDSAGVSTEMFSLPHAPPALRDLLRSECEFAEHQLRAGLPLAKRVPHWFASDVRLFVHGGLATARAIARVDYDVLARRPTVGRWQQFSMLFRAAAGLL